MLFPTRAEVKRVNDEMFNKLRSQPRTYMCLDHFKWNEHHRNLESKKMIAGDGRSLQALADHRYEPQMQLKKGMLVVLLHNIDLPAGLVNGSQGTIQGFEDYDPTKMPKATGKGKESDVAHTGAALVGDYAALREQQMKAFVQQAPFKKWPIVTFLNGVTRTIFADCTVNELGDKPPYSLLSRTQIPLMAAWAMTTHKSQVCGYCFFPVEKC
jgi:ATP-dependent DNA helicase PIF1